MKKIANGLLIVMLCISMCITGGMISCVDTYATATTGNANTQSSNSNTNNNIEDDEKDETLQKTKKNAVREIKEYAKIIKIKVTSDKAKQIDEIIKKYIDVIGTANGNKNESGLSTENSVIECVTEAKSVVDALVTGEGTDENGVNDENTAPSSTSEFVMVGGNWVTPIATYGQVVNVVLPVVNMSTVNLNNVTVTPVISNSVMEWPFEIETSGYTQTIVDLPGKGNGQNDMDRRRELTWSLKTRDDALSGYYKLQFNVIYYVGTEVENATLTTYVFVKGAPGSGNIETEGAGTSTPRVIITGYETNPKEVHAGDTFTLTLHLKNTSMRTAVSNMLVNLSAPSEGMDAESVYAAFLPTSGSNTEYITSIGKGQTTDLSIELTAKADLVQKPYQLDVVMEYEDDDYTSYTASADVSIPILQEARFELSTPEVLPQSIMVGNESNIMFSLYNTGKVTLYNVKAYIEDDTVTGGEVFLGKIDAGGTGSVDLMVTGAAPSSADETVKIVVSYEDEAGNKSTYEQDLNLVVTEDAVFGDGMMDPEMDFDMEEFEYEEEGGNRSWIVVVLVLVVLIAVGVVLGVVLVKRRRKKEDEERVNLLDELDEDESKGKDNSDEIS